MSNAAGQTLVDKSSDYNYIYSRLKEAQELLFKLVEQEVAIDGHHKSYEGALNIRLPGVYEDTTDICLILSCYGCPMNGRAHYYEAPTLLECIDKLMFDLYIWQEDLETRDE